MNPLPSWRNEDRSRFRFHRVGGVGSCLFGIGKTPRVEQAETAAQLGVDMETVKNRERGALQLAIVVTPKVIEFLGTNPLPKPTTFAERLVFYQTCRGLRQSELAARLASAQGRSDAGKLA